MTRWHAFVFAFLLAWMVLGRWFLPVLALVLLLWGLSRLVRSRRRRDAELRRDFYADRWPDLGIPRQPVGAAQFEARETIRRVDPGYGELLDLVMPLDR